MARVETCEECGDQIRIGDYPMCKGVPGKHRPPLTRYHPFRTFVDPNISTRGGIEISSITQWDRELRRNGLEVSTVEDRERAETSRQKEEAAKVDTAFERAWGESCREVLGGDMGTTQLTE